MNAQPPTRATVQVPLEVLDSILASALQAAVRHALAGLPDSTRGVLWHRAAEVEGLATARVHAALAASGYVTRDGLAETVEGV